jgi:hypothetical protein
MTQKSLHPERMLGDIAEVDLAKTAVYGRALVKRSGIAGGVAL